MSRIQQPNKMHFERRIRRLERMLIGLKRRTIDINEKYCDLLSNQRHYLKYRAPGVLHKQKLLMQQAQNFLKRTAGMPQFKTTCTYSKSKRTKHVLMLDGNQANKLAAMLNLDFRRLINALPGGGRLGAKRAVRLGYTGRPIQA